MNSNTQKLVAYVALALICAAIIAVWGVFAFYGKTPVDGFISQLGGLLTIVVGAIAALGATHVATAASAKSQLLAGTLSDLAAPLSPITDPTAASQSASQPVQQ